MTYRVSVVNALTNKTKQSKNNTKIHRFLVWCSFMLRNPIPFLNYFQDYLHQHLVSEHLASFLDRLVGTCPTKLFWVRSSIYLKRKEIGN